MAIASKLRRTAAKLSAAVERLARGGKIGMRLYGADLAVPDPDDRRCAHRQRQPAGGAPAGDVDQRQHAAALGVELVGPEANVVDRTVERGHIPPRAFAPLVGIGLGRHRGRNDQHEIIREQVDDRLDVTTLEGGEDLPDELKIRFRHDTATVAPNTLTQMSRSDTVGRGELLARFDALGLDALDAKASLQRRVDNKYLVSWDQLADLFDGLGADHQVLEIDDRRWFSYESTYFDTASLRCFRDHVGDRVPRFKVRSRLYADSGKCNFEVKVKRHGDQTDKQQIEIEAGRRDRIDPEGASFLDRALREVPDPPAPDDFAPTLTTSFCRCTLAAANESERVTCDHSLELRSHRGASARLRDELVVVETKTEDGKGRCDRLLAEAGIESVSFSKYRVGVGLLIAEDPDPPLADRLHDVFRTATRDSGS